MATSENKKTSLKELPTRELKLKRHKARKETHTIHPVRLRLKSSISPLNLETEGEKYFSDRSISSPDNANQDVASSYKASSHSHVNSLPSSPLTTETNSELLETFLSSNSADEEDYDQPLDMSRKGLQQAVSVESRGLQQKQLRPSVITCASALLRTQCNLTDMDHQMCTAAINNDSFDSTDSLVREKQKNTDVFESKSVHSSYKREIVSVGSCDPVIDEHFRRSLGKDYQHVFSESSNSSVSLTVDDHFAKALGEKWFQLQQSKSVSVDTVSSHSSNSLQTSSQAPFHHPPAEIVS